MVKTTEKQLLTKRLDKLCTHKAYEINRVAGIPMISIHGVLPQYAPGLHTFEQPERDIDEQSSDRKGRYAATRSVSDRKSRAKTHLAASTMRKIPSRSPKSKLVFEVIFTPDIYPQPFNRRRCRGKAKAKGPGNVTKISPRSW